LSVDGDQSINAHPGKFRDSILYLYPDDVVAYHQQVRQNGLVVPELDVTFYGSRNSESTTRMETDYGSDKTHRQAPDEVNILDARA